MDSPNGFYVFLNLSPFLQEGRLQLCSWVPTEFLSPTDLECTWKKPPASLQYDHAKPASEFCHVTKTAAPFVLDDNEAEELRNQVMELFPDFHVARLKYVRIFCFAWTPTSDAPMSFLRSFRFHCLCLMNVSFVLPKLLKVVINLGWCLTYYCYCYCE